MIWETKKKGEVQFRRKNRRGRGTFKTVSIQPAVSWGLEKLKLPTIVQLFLCIPILKKKNEGGENVFIPLNSEDTPRHPTRPFPLCGAKFKEKLGPKVLSQAIGMKDRSVSEGKRTRATAAKVSKNFSIGLGKGVLLYTPFKGAGREKSREGYTKHRGHGTKGSPRSGVWLTFARINKRRKGILDNNSSAPEQGSVKKELRSSEKRANARPISGIDLALLK